MSAKQRYEAALAAEDWETAEAILRQGLAQSGDLRILTLLGAFLRKRSRLAEAEALMAPAAESAPSAELLDHLALIQYERQSFADCERTLERLIAIAPESPLSNYQMLGKLKAARLGPSAARELMLRARIANPDRTEFLAAYTDTLPPAEAVVELTSQLDRLRGDPARTAYLLLRIASYRAAPLREARGLPRWGTSWADTIQWPDRENLPALKNALRTEIAMGSPRASARLTLACIALAEDDWELAEKYLLELRNGSKRTSADFVAFGADFHAALDEIGEADISKDLVRVERLRSAPESAQDEAVFMASDPKYFAEFTLPFLRQLDGMRIPLCVHVHLMDGSSQQWKDADQTLAALTVVNASLTAEAEGAAEKDRGYARCYYHAVRYIRFFDELRRSRRPMWVFDCDVELLRDPRPFLSKVRDYDVALRTSPTAIEPTLKITASSVGVAPTARGLEFARRVAAYVLHWKTRASWGWGVDQAALLSAYAFMVSQGRTPRTLFLDDFATNERTGDTGAIRFMPGIGKYAADGRPAAAASQE